MTRGATDNDTTAHREHGEPADLASGAGTRSGTEAA
jgi:hypothetical protein